MKLGSPYSWVAALAKLTGSIDRLGRPVVRVEVSGGDGFLALVDTGFNGELIMAEPDARVLGFAVSTKIASATLAGGQVQRLFEGTGSIHWMGAVRRVELFVSPAVPARRMDDDPIAIIGTRLLTPHLLLIDFASRSVEIETQG